MFFQSKAAHLLRIFLLSMTVTAQLLTLVVFSLLHLLPWEALVIAGCLMVILTSCLLRPIRTRRKTAALLSIYGRNLLSLCITGVCLTGCILAPTMGGTLSAMFGSRDLGTAPSVTPNHSAMDAFGIYLSGSDDRDGRLTESRSDVNIIAIVSPAHQQILLVNTPRDTYISNPAASNAMDKLAHCSLYGTDNSRLALSHLYNIPIAYAAQINFNGFEHLIDALGGVTVYSDTAFTTTIGGYAIQAGENKLNGAKALAFARERSKLTAGDISRGSNQMQLLAALVSRASPRTIMTNYLEILSSLEGMFATDMPLQTITTLVTTEADDLNDWEILTYSVTGTDGTDYNYSAKSYAYVLYPDANSVSHASALMQRMLEGNALSADDVTQ